MIENNHIWLNGELHEWAESKIHLLTHGLHYGSSVFEGIRFYPSKHGKAVFRLEEHMARLHRSAAAINFTIPYSVEELIQATIDMLAKSPLESGYIRPISFIGYGQMSLQPKDPKIDTAIAVWGWNKYLSENPIKVKISKFIRMHPKSAIPSAKLGGYYVNSILASNDAHQAGFDEALQLDHEGFIAEGPGENFFFIKNGELHTPSKGNILEGITRASIMEIAHNKGIIIHEGKYTIEDIEKADEAFFTGTVAEVSPIAQINDTIFNNGKIGPLSEFFKENYRQITHGEQTQYHHWLTFIN